MQIGSVRLSQISLLNLTRRVEDSSAFAQLPTTASRCPKSMTTRSIGHNCCIRGGNRSAGGGGVAHVLKLYTIGECDPEVRRRAV